MWRAGHYLECGPSEKKGPRHEPRPSFSGAMLPQAQHRRNQLSACRVSSTTRATNDGGDAVGLQTRGHMSPDRSSNTQNGRPACHLRRDRGACKHDRRSLHAPGGYELLPRDRAHPHHGDGDSRDCHRRRHWNWTRSRYGEHRGFRMIPSCCHAGSQPPCVGCVSSRRCCQTDCQSSCAPVGLGRHHNRRRQLEPS